MSKILFFTIGDSSDPSTWSNVPYCFSKALEEAGHSIIRVNLKAPTWVIKLWNNTTYKVIRHFQNGSLYSFERTHLAKWYMNSQIKKATKTHSDAALSVFTCFSCYNQYSKNPSVLLCDWSLEYYISERLKRKPYWLECQFIKRESNVIKSADYVVSLFPDCGQFMQKQIPGSTIHYLNQNVLNIIDSHSNLDHLPRIKNKSNTILFIGNEKYLTGATKLLEAFELLKEEFPHLSLAYIGLTAKQLGIENENNPRISFYGFLHKSKASDNETYYKLLRESKIIVNTSGLWAGFSSMIEAMYYYTPVIVSPYSSFTATFGENITFGKYDKEGTSQSLANYIKEIFLSDNYEEMCQKAHSITSDFTWDNYVNRLLKEINI